MKYMFVRFQKILARF